MWLDISSYRLQQHNIGTYLPREHSKDTYPSLAPAAIITNNPPADVYQMSYKAAAGIQITAPIHSLRSSGVKRFLLALYFVFLAVDAHSSVEAHLLMIILRYHAVQVHMYTIVQTGGEERL